jgi:hypothetical protein
MVKTSYRSKLGKALSYPLGTEEISRVLEGVPQTSLSLSFYDKPTTFASEFQRLLTEGQPYVILRASFTRRDWGIGVQVGDCNGAWDITVYPTPRADRVVAHAQLLSVGLPAVRRWLCMARPSTWYFGRKRCEVLFAPADGTVSVRAVAEGA